MHTKLQSKQDHKKYCRLQQTLFLLYFCIRLRKRHFTLPFIFHNTELLQSLVDQFVCQIFSGISIMLYIARKKDTFWFQDILSLSLLFVIKNISSFMWRSYILSARLPKIRFLGFDTRTGTMLLHMSAARLQKNMFFQKVKKHTECRRGHSIHFMEWLVYGETIFD